MDSRPPALRPTTLAEDRTVLAAEPTSASWLRTGMAFLASGLAARRVLQEVLQSCERRVLATVLILRAVACFAAGAWRDTRVRLRPPEPDIHLPPRVFTLGVSVADPGLPAGCPAGLDR